MRRQTSRIALCGVVAALSVVVLFMTGIVPVATVALPAVAGCFLIAVVAETSVRWGVMVYAVVSVLSLFLVPDREAALLYVVFFGYYPALYGALGRVRNRVLCRVLKFLVFNAAIVLESLLAIFLLHVPMAEMLPFGRIIPSVAVLCFCIRFGNLMRQMHSLANEHPPTPRMIVMPIKRLGWYTWSPSQRC